MTARSPGGPVYELVVSGTLGPVLRCALARYASATSEYQTVVRAWVPADRDLVDLVRVLASRGLEIADIHELT